MRRLVLSAVLCAVPMALLPGVASAQITAQGSPLTSPANYPYNCDTRWVAGTPGNPGGFGDGGYQDFVEQDFFVFSGGVRSSCTIFQTGATTQTSHIVPNSGKVTVARVKSGPNPAPLSIATVRQFTGKRQSDGQLVTTCCQGISETSVVNPTPNGITEIPVNFLVLSKPYDSQKPSEAGYRDWVVVNVDVTTGGTLPMYDKGLPRPIGPVASDQGATWHFPQIDPSQTNQNAWIANGFEVLMNYDWVPTEATTPGDGATPTPNPTGTPDANACPTGAAARAAAACAAEIRSSKVRLRRGRIAVSVKCARADGSACKGKVTLRTAAKKPVLLASRTINIAAGKSQTVSVSLSSSARKRLRGKAKVRIEVAVTGQAAITKDVKLGR